MTDNVMIIIQSNKDGAIYDLAPVTKSADWKTKRKGAPASLELDVLTDIDFPYGSTVILKANGTSLFMGRLFKIKRARQNQVTLTFYDQIKHLLRNNSYVFKDKNIAQIIETICKDFELDVGKLNAPTVKLPTLLKEDKSGIDIIQECQDQLIIQTGRLTVFWDDVGKLRLDMPENMRIDKVLADASIISDFDWEGSIEDSANIVKLVRDNKKTGKRETYTVYDSHYMKQWGKLQYFKKLDEKVNDAQATEMANMYLNLKRKPAETVSLSFSMGDYDFRAGRAVYVDVKEINLHGWYVLEEVSHSITPSGHTMECKLFIPREGGS